MNIPMISEKNGTSTNDLIEPQDLYDAIVEMGGTTSPRELAKRFDRTVNIVGLSLKQAVDRGYIEKTGQSAFSAIAEDEFEEPSLDEIADLFPGCTARIELIGPRKASQSLKNMAPNRNVGSGSNRVKEYAEAMSGSRWHLSQPIIYDNLGRLIDGQHRMLAVISSRKQVFFWVIRGIDTSAMVVLDSGKPRSASDSLQVAGVDADKSRVAILKSMFVKVGIATTRPYEDYGKIQVLYVRHKQAIDFAAKNRSEGGVQRCTSNLIRAAIARAYFYCVDVTRKNYRHDDLRRLDRFCWVLDNGFTETSIDRIPAALRDYWLYNRSKQSDDARKLLYAKTVKAIKRYLDGEILNSSKPSLPIAKTQYFPVKDFD